MTAGRSKWCTIIFSVMAAYPFLERVVFDLPGGEHFLMIRAEPEAIPTKINIVYNWFEELKRLVPTCR